MCRKFKDNYVIIGAITRNTFRKGATASMLKCCYVIINYSQRDTMIDKNKYRIDSQDTASQAVVAYD